MGDVKGDVGPDDEVDEIVGFARAGWVEETAVHEQDGEFGEEDGWAVKHFRDVSQLVTRSVLVVNTA